MNITASLPPSLLSCLPFCLSSSSCLHRRFFPSPLSSSHSPLPSPSPLFIAAAQRPRRTRPQLPPPPLLQPPHPPIQPRLQRHPTCLPSLPFNTTFLVLPLCTAAQPWRLRAGPSLPPGGRTSRRSAAVSAAHKRNAREEEEKNRGIFFLSFSALEESCSPAASICAKFFLTSRPLLPPHSDYSSGFV